MTTGIWHSLSLRVTADKLDVSFDGASVLSAHDETFGEAGKTGLWTKADSLTHFAEFTVQSL